MPFNEEFKSLPKVNKTKSQTPKPKSYGSAKVQKPYLVGICGGPSSGMSTVAKNIGRELKMIGITHEIISLKDFYIPIRGNLRRNRSRAGSLQEEENQQEVLK